MEMERGMHSMALLIRGRYEPKTARGPVQNANLPEIFIAGAHKMVYFQLLLDHRCRCDQAATI
jgi:hypothetical protein